MSCNKLRSKRSIGQPGLKRKGKWTEEEDDKIKKHVEKHGDHHWDTVAQQLDLGRNGSSCRQRWRNHLKPGIVRGNITDEEMLSILKLHSELGNEWSKIARQLPERTDKLKRTDMEIKNLWNVQFTNAAKKLNLNVKSAEFLKIMTKILMERIRLAAGATAVPPPTSTTPPAGVAGGHGGGVSLVTFSSTGPIVNCRPNIDAPYCSDDSWSGQELGINSVSVWSSIHDDSWFEQEFGSSLDYIWTDDNFPSI